MPRPTSAPATPWRAPDGADAGRVAPPARWRTPASTVRRVAAALLVALIAAVGVGVTWRVFVGTAQGQAVDQASLDGAHIGQNRLWEVAEPVLDVVSVGFIAAAVVACAVIAFARRRWGLALVAAGVLAGANVTTRVLKYWVLDRPDLGYGPDFNTLPSGHTTAAASVAVAVLLVVPPRTRPWVAVLGGAYAGATGVSTLVGQWHRPSDVVAGLLVVLAWGALACAVLALGVDTAGDRRPPTAALRTVGRGAGTGRGPGTTVALWLLAAVTVLAGAAAAVALRRTWSSDDPVGSTAALLTSYGGGALGIVAVAAASSGALLVLRRSATSGADRVGPTS
ncbi:phosphatase PAP2 family protein [Cellulomonas sp. ACRRI]|uniref:phosphatase PAP2 family protein n=1 Tax=Cellulomonas sp. ACRRI TaxID=2918188 RepID=UPI001EF31877|nr:phosphatase PAP2 family protein [Cellulomonas sp. ACRRI]MCG7286166.1 phosphatase PAP2 family protein [Cellulomonas sp. ACRRI]